MATAKDTARKVFEYVLRDLRSPAGTFYAAQDADEAYYTAADRSRRSRPRREEDVGGVVDVDVRDVDIVVNVGDIERLAHLAELGELLLGDGGVALEFIHVEGELGIGRDVGAPAFADQLLDRREAG